MMTAVKGGFEHCVIALLASGAAAQLATAGNYDLLHELLLAAVHADRFGVVAELLQKFGSHISLKRLMPLLQAALQHSPGSFMCLFQPGAVPAAARIQAKELGQLVRWAGRWFRHGIFYEVLNWHRAWSSVSPEDKLVSLLQLALQQGADCRSFCVHPCAAAVDVELAWLLLHFAVVTEQRSNLEALLLLLPAAAKLGKDRLVELMLVAVQGAAGPANLANLSRAEAPAAAGAAAAGSSTAGGSSSVVDSAPKQPQQQYMFRRPITPAAPTAASAGGSAAAAATSSGNAAATSGGAAAAAEGGSTLTEQEKQDDITWPLQNLSLSGSAAASKACLSVLCQWDAAACIGANGLLQLLQAAAKCAACGTAAAGSVPARSQPDFSAVQQLCSSRAAAGISSAAELQPLLQLLLTHHDAASVGELLRSCPAAAAIDAAMLGELPHCSLSPAGRSNACDSHSDMQYSEEELLSWAAAAAKVTEPCIAVVATAGMGITVGLLQDLLMRAVQQRDGTVAAALCKCQAAAQLSSDVIQAALAAAAAAAPALHPPEADTAAGQQGAAAGGCAGTGGESEAAAADGKKGSKAGRRCKRARRQGRT
jgi:hypothetical protein